MKALIGASAAVALGLGSAVAGGVSANAAPAKPVLVADQFAKYSTSSSWTDGQNFGPWQVVFAGYGSVSVPAQRPRSIRLAPAAASDPGQTHAALVVSKKQLKNRCISVISRLKTHAQLRTGTPANPWETGWLIWDYTDNDHFSYLALKTNGWELGKRDPAYPGGQRFLATGDSPASAVGQWRTARIKRIASADGTSSTTHAYISGVRVTTFVDAERPYRAGKVGMYTEDAAVDVDYLRANRC